MAFSASLVDVLNSDDVILAEITAGLHFDQFERDLALVGQAMDGPEWVGLRKRLRALDAVSEGDALRVKAGIVGWFDETLARLYYLRGNALFPLGDHEACLSAHSEAAKHAERSGSPLARARAQSGLGDAHYIAGRLRTDV